MSRYADPSLVNKIVLGEVATVQNYGAFIKLPGGPNQGLVHRTQISKVNVPDASEVLARGDKVWCKIISINDDGKIGLSMKVVDQGSGKDLDPNGVQMKFDEQKRKEWVPGSQKKAISLEAVYNTTCSRCGTKGHLRKDCFQVDGKTYSLLSDEEPERAKSETTNQNQDETDYNVKEKDKKLKKAKKKMKKALRKELKQLKKELKKKKKKDKKRRSKHSSSDDSSSSSSSSSESDDKGSHKSVKEKMKNSFKAHEKEASFPAQVSTSRRKRSPSPFRGHSSRVRSRSPSGKSLKYGERKRSRSRSPYYKKSER